MNFSISYLQSWLLRKDTTSISTRELSLFIVLIVGAELPERSAL